MARRRTGGLLRRHLGTEADRATFHTLHTASLMTGALRTGLTAESAERSVRHLRSLLAAPAVALTDTERLLAWDGHHAAHAVHAGELARRAVDDGATTVLDHAVFPCEDPYCPLRKAILSPLVVDDRVIGTLQVFGGLASAALVRATEEVAGWVSGQLELAELDASRTRLMEAEVRALRAQISPHFIYNALNAIASFVRTDPDRARQLLLDFADFTRYSFQRHGEYTTLEEELRSIERYLVLEQARFGERLQVTLRIAPEVLPVTVPVLSVQPLVENAVRHGLAQKAGTGRITILAEDHDREAVISVEDDGVGEDPERVRRALAGDESLDSVGLGNVDERLRSAYGDDYGLVVETAPGAGTKVTMRVPKYAAGVRP
ncbi:sensor histidine kinase [Nocardioides terrisoli]|uniref:sensor histidine kinase n=1 Tax=Nocardioides terrisoli TaxID=3388267 RepID=UPI00287B7D9C|nr:histidine kinase [Nocardioides marmorisolisilvae]